MKRIISRIDIKNDWIVKGIHLEGLRAIGQPNEYAYAYYQQGIDEIVLMDVVASLYQRNSLFELTSKIAKEVFIPITVGGGLRSLDNISRALSCGADKVSINTAAHANPDFVKEAAERFGSSTIVIGIEAIKGSDGVHYCFTDNGREKTGRTVAEWARQVESLGAGEILLTSVDNEGTGVGFDLELTKEVARIVKIPVVAHGGAGKVEHLISTMTAEEDISGVCIASMLHYHLAREVGYQKPINSAHAGASLSRRKVEDISVQCLKDQLVQAGIPVRTCRREPS